MVAFLTGSSIIAIILVQLIKAGLKKYIGKDYQSLSTQIVLVLVSVILAVIGAITKILPQEILITGGTIAAEAMIIYEVIYKAVIQEAIRGK